MWILFGMGAIIFAVLNLIWTFQSRNKTVEWFRFISMALTALTLCAFYSDGASRVVTEDWSGLRNYAEFIQSFYAETNRLLRRFSNRNVLIISA